MIRRFALALLVMASTALADDRALRELIPLIEVYDARKASPGYDVAGIRCAGLIFAQLMWVEDHPGSAGRPPKKRRDAVETYLTLAEQHRLGEGQGLVEAQGSTKRDLHAVAALYRARFQSSDRNPPWQSDRLVTTDLDYCDILAR